MSSALLVAPGSPHYRHLIEHRERWLEVADEARQMHSATGHPLCQQLATRAAAAVYALAVHIERCDNRFAHRPRLVRRARRSAHRRHLLAMADTSAAVRNPRFIS